MGTWAKGVVFTFGSAISEIRGLSGVGGSADTIDTSTHSSPSEWREHIGGWADGSEVSIDGVFDSTHKSLLPLVGTKQADATITFPLTPVETFTADMIMTNFEITGNHEELILYSATFKISGQPTMTAAA